MLAEAISTVAGRLMIILFCGVGLTDVGHRGADVARELELGAGEALGRILEHPLGRRDRRRRSCLTSLAADTAMSTMPL